MKLHMPHFIDTSGLTWQPVTIHICHGSLVGPYAEIECQSPGWPGELKTFVYSLDNHSLGEHDQEEIIGSTALPGRFQDALRNLFNIDC